MNHTDTTTTPVEELSTAAARLRETAVRAMPGPWKNLDDGDRILARKTRVPGKGGWAEEVLPRYVVPEPLNPGNAAWIALANPALAEPLAAWLENVTQAYPTLLSVIAEGGQEVPARSELGHALKIARAINGGTA